MSSANSSTHFDGGYKRPPIVEAVIEFRMAELLPPDDVEKMRQKFSVNFPNILRINQTQIQFHDLSGEPIVNQTPSGYRMTDLEGLNIVVITGQNISISRIAPYSGWDTFSTAALSIFERFRDEIGYVRIGRIGVRYVNRIDIPVQASSEVVRLERYVRIQPQYPESDLPALSAFTMQTVFNLAESRCMAAVNVASVPAPFPQFMSMILDIDIGRNENVPQRRDGIRGLLDTMRNEKNRIFEVSITDTTRELFNQ